MDPPVGRLALLLALVASLSVAASACDDDEGEQLRIGVLGDFSGPLAEFGPLTLSAVELAIKHINEAGGVNGQDVVFVTGDTRVDPTQAVEEARRLIDVEGVHAIAGPLASSSTLAVIESVAARRAFRWFRPRRPRRRSPPPTTTATCSAARSRTPRRAWCWRSSRPTRA